RGAQTSFHRFVDEGPLRDSRYPQTVGDVVVNRFRKWIRFLENHADPPPEIDDVHAGRVDIDAFDSDRALRDAGAVDEIVHAIEAAEQRGLAAAGRSDESGDRSRGNAQVDAVQDLMRAVSEIELLDLDHAAFGFRFRNPLGLVDDDR